MANGRRWWILSLTTSHWSRKQTEVFTRARKVCGGILSISSAAAPTNLSDPVGCQSLFQLQGVVTVNPDGRTAKARWYGMGMEAKPTVSLHEGEPRQIWIHGIYENECVVRYHCLSSIPRPSGSLISPLFDPSGRVIGPSDISTPLSLRYPTALSMFSTSIAIIR
jgi:hypothetical protein